ncbi:ubiquitin-domain-containing protein [Lentinus tigrinus ALCF2SS1-7]|uniref:Ubiquitin-domain-containing protein n=1 Tax=Lentinus tigrinus ALCF2SS1-6 TaxID=1328759 RepID=A0A5C2RV92_9APHY|nr:ubiquitin-domain-containing protein [Lentinus tigrinus ALCF2SS1-6]RPD74120.1 ubiquitin-domain-containing protein [Lentinus tigrinus ALCF2SS1-7]
MAEQAELAFVKSFANAISSQPVVYGNDYQTAPENELKKVPVLPIDVPPPPERRSAVSAPTGSISVTFKSTKPVQAYTLDVQPTDTIAQIKAQLSAVPGAPPADAQRLLLKGKALADGKLLREYAAKDGDTINLMVKPGFDWDPSKTSTPAPAPVASPAPSASALTTESESVTLLPSPEPKTRGGHGRIPSVVLSPSPSLTPSPGEKLVDIPLVLDTSNIPASPSAVSDTPYHTTIAKPEFWEKLHTFLQSQFPHSSDAAAAWEDFFCASKGNLSVSEIAKIRDAVGVIGMGGN